MPETGASVSRFDPVDDLAGEAAEQALGVVADLELDALDADRVDVVVLQVAVEQGALLDEADEVLDVVAVGGEHRVEGVAGPDQVGERQRRAGLGGQRALGLQVRVRADEEVGRLGMHAVDQRLRQRRRPVGLRHGRVQRERAADLLAQGEPGRELRAGDVAIVALEAIAVVAELGDRHRARRQRDRVLHEEGADAALAGGRQAAADRGGVVGRHLVVEGVEHEGHGVVGPAEREAGVGRRPDAVRRGRVRAFRPDREQADLVEELLVDVGDGPVERGVDGEGAGGVDRPVQDRVGRVHVVVARAAAVDPGAERRGEFREAQRDPLALGRREGGLGEPGEVVSAAATSVPSPAS